MNRKLLIALALIGSSFVPVRSHSFADDDKAIEGMWVIVDAELGGQKLPDEGLKGARLVLQEGRYQFQTDQGEYKLHLTGEIKAMDILGKQGPNQGKTFLAIYELRGDTLMICYDLTGKDRPKAFKTEVGTRQFLVTYQKSNQ